MDSLSSEDPTVFAVCRICNKSGNGVKLGDIFCKAYSERRWKRGQVCENCGGSLTEVFRIEQD